MKKKSWWIFVIIFIVIIVILFLLCFSNNSSKIENIRIGVVTPLTGNGATLGKPMVEGMEIAVNEINSNGGINGKKIKLYVEDGKMEGSTTNTATQFIIDNYNPQAMVTLYHIDAEVMSPLTKKAEIPLLHASFARSLLSSNPTAFKINFDAVDGCKQLIEYAKANSKYKKLGVLMSRVAYNEYCLEGAKEVESNIAEYWYNFGDTDFRTLLIKAQKDGVDALLTVGIDFEYVEMFKQMSELGYNGKLFCATASECINPELSKANYPAFENTLSVDFVNPKTIETSNFSEKYKEEFPGREGSVITYAGIGYDSVMILKDAFNKCDSNDKRCIINSLESYKDLKNDSVIGTIGFNDRVLKLDYNIYEYENESWVMKN
jgi:branched-chain amino acid transport system substrate-binding protein